MKLLHANLKEIFLKISDCPIIHQLRNSQIDLVLPFSKSQFKKKTLSYSGATLWNNLPITAKQANFMSYTYKCISQVQVCVCATNFL
jgi:hypothetical protein